MPSQQPIPGRCGKPNRRTDLGGYCTQYPIPGTDTCRTHNTRRTQALQRKTVAMELAKWTLSTQNTDIDPGETTLRLLSQSVARADYYAAKLAEAVQHGDRLQELAKRQAAGQPLDDGEVDELRQHTSKLDHIFTTGGLSALIGHTWAMTQKGQKYATGEEIRALAKLETDERKLAGHFAKTAASMGIAEREIRIREQLGAMIFTVVAGSLTALGVTWDEIQVREIVQGQLAAAASDTPPAIHA